MHLAFQMGDINSLITGRTVGAELLGASTWGEGGGGRDWVIRGVMNGWYQQLDQLEVSMSRAAGACNWREWGVLGLVAK